MPEIVASLPWTDEQWAGVQQLVQETARRARIASSFLPLVGPLPPGQASVPALLMTQPGLLSRQRGEPAQRLEIDDGDTLKLTTISCEVYLTTQQADDPDLASAKQMLGRVADVIGRLEDAIVFRGQPGPGAAPKTPAGALVVQPDVYMVQGGQKNFGLLEDDGKLCKQPVDRKKVPDDLVRAVVDSIQELEGRGHYGPFACVLGHELYRIATTPNAPSLVLPSDRIVPFLDGGPLRRSSVVPPEQGVVVALAGSPIDLVVATDVHVKFLQLSVEPRYVLRVSERFVLRMKQPEARCRLEAK